MTFTTLINLLYECCVQIARLFHWKRRDAQFIVLLGGPGAGKGTVADKLAPRLNLPHLNMGKIIGREIAQGTAFGRRWASTVKAGRLIPDSAVVQLLITELSDARYYAGAVLDGFPRTVYQAKKLRHRLAWWGNRIDCAVYLEVPKDDLVERLSLRRTCSEKSCNKSYHLKFQPPVQEGKCDACGGDLFEREDQKPEAIITRLAEFNRTFAPLKRYYQAQGNLVTVLSTNNLGPNEVYEQVLFAIDEVD